MLFSDEITTKQLLHDLVKSSHKCRLLGSQIFLTITKRLYGKYEVDHRGLVVLLPSLYAVFIHRIVQNTSS